MNLWRSLTPGWRRTIRFGGTSLILAAVGVLFWRALANNWAEVLSQNLEPSWPMVAAIIVFAIAVPLSGLLWGQIVNQLSSTTKISSRESMAVHSASWLLKYIPGQVGSLINKVLWGQKNGVSRTLILITFIYENVFLLLASLFPSVAILLMSLGISVFENNVLTVVLPIVAVIPLIAVLSRRIFHRLMSLASRRFLKHKLPTEFFLPTRSTILYLVEFMLPRAINGIGFVIVAGSFMHVPPEHWLPLGATYVLAGAVGILAVFVPSGLGVREAIIFLFALQYMTPAQAVIASLLARLLSTIADAIVAVFYAVLRVSLRRTGAPSVSGRS